MTKEKLLEKKKELEDQLQKMRGDMIATQGAIQGFQMLLDEWDEPASSAGLKKENKNGR